MQYYAIFQLLYGYILNGLIVNFVILNRLFNIVNIILSKYNILSLAVRYFYRIEIIDVNMC